MADTETRQTFHGRTRLRLGLGLCTVALLEACAVQDRDYSKLVARGGEGGQPIAASTGGEAGTATAAGGAGGDAAPTGGEAGTATGSGATGGTGGSSSPTGGEAGLTAAGGATGGATTVTGGATGETGGSSTATGGSPGEAGHAGSGAERGGAGGEEPGRAGQGGAGGTAGLQGGEAGAAGMPAQAGAGGAGCETTDPACECVDGVLQARDVDEDGQGDINCVEAPGADCDDADDTWIANECGGCTVLTGAVGDPCGDCGELGCNATLDALVCVSPTPQPRRCTTTVAELCVAGYWTSQGDCAASTTTPICYDGTCVECVPGTFRCVDDPTYDAELVWPCGSTGSWASTYIESCWASSSEYCDATAGTCVSELLHPRDRSFEVPLVPDLERQLTPGPGVSTQDLLDRATGFEFA